jgi:hypothetical protein
MRGQLRKPREHSPTGLQFRISIFVLAKVYLGSVHLEAYREWSIKWVEVTLIDRLCFPRLGSMEIGIGLDGSGRSVQWNSVNVNRSLLCADLHNPKGGGSSSPRVTENGLAIAVEIC